MKLAAAAVPFHPPRRRGTNDALCLADVDKPLMKRLIAVPAILLGKERYLESFHGRSPEADARVTSIRRRHARPRCGRALGIRCSTIASSIDRLRQSQVPGDALYDGLLLADSAACQTEAM